MDESYQTKFLITYQFFSS